MTATIRVATAADAARCAAIYAPYVTDTPITFETEPPSIQEMARRIEAANDRHAWLVMEEAGEIVGYAYGGPFKARAAYRWAAESSVYLHVDRCGGGRGRALYAELIERLRHAGCRRLVGIIAQPNEPSMRLHRRFGFAEAGTLHRVGWKHGGWHDVAYLELDLTPGDDSIPTPPGRPASTTAHTTAHTAAAAADAADIQRLVDCYYRAFTSGPGAEERVDALRAAMMPGAIIVRTCGQEPALYDVESFIEPRLRMLTDGTLRDFHEHATTGHIEVFGDMAQWFGRYAKEGLLDGEPYAGGGTKSIQFARTGAGWRITAAIWDDDRADPS